MAIKGIISVNMCCSIVLCLIMISLVLALIFKNSSQYQMVLDISNNHKSTVILDIILDDYCPEENRILSNSYYQGTVDGCKCINTLRKGKCNQKDVFCYNVYKTDKKKLLFWRKSSLCLKKDNSSKYATFIENKKTNNKRKEKKNKKEEQINGYNYKALWTNAVKKGEDCPSGFKNCGVLDTTENVMCIDNKLSCPIKYVYISENIPDKELNAKEVTITPQDSALINDNLEFAKDINKNSLQSIINEENLFLADNTPDKLNYEIKNEHEQTKYIKLSDNKYIIFSNDNYFKEYYKDKNIIYAQNPIEFKTFEEEICANSSEYYKNAKGNYKLDYYPNGLDYVNKCSSISSKITSNYINNIINNLNYLSTSLEEQDKTKINKYYHDNRYNKLDTISKYEFYNNNIVLPLVENLPDYPLEEIKDININLYSRSFLGISKSCHESYANPDVLESYLYKISELNTFIILLIVLSFINFVILIMLLCSYNNMISYFFKLFVLLALFLITWYYINTFVVFSIDDRIYNCLDSILATTIRFIQNRNEKLFVFMNYYIYVLYTLSGIIIVLTILLLTIGNSGRHRLFNNDDEGFNIETNANNSIKYSDNLESKVEYKKIE